MAVIPREVVAREASDNEVEVSVPSSVPSVVNDSYFSVHSGTRPGVQGAPAASMSRAGKSASKAASILMLPKS